MSKRYSTHDGIKVIQGDGTEVLLPLQAPRRKPSLRAVGPRGVMRNIILQRGMSFGELQELLGQLGFQPALSSGGFQAFREEGTGALVILPDYKASDEVRSLHLNTLRKLLVEKGLVDSVTAVGLER